MKSLQRILAAACAERDHPWALATLVTTEGSTYRQTGARMLVSPDGTTIGVLSGGCLEEEIARHGIEVMISGNPQLVEFDTRRLYGCEGRLGVFIERIPPMGNEGNFLTEIASKVLHRSVCRISVNYGDERGFSEVLPDRLLTVEKKGTFVQTLQLPTRLLVFGTGPEIQPMRLFAAGLGWLMQEYAHPDEMPLDFKFDDQTAAVVMTHNFGRDLAALDRLLPMELSYLGLLGPKRRQRELLSRFQDFKELNGEWLENVYAPAGLDVGSESPEEIALSIVSEIGAVLARRRGGFLRDKVKPIHQIEPAIREA